MSTTKMAHPKKTFNQPGESKTVEWLLDKDKGLIYFDAKNQTTEGWWHKIKTKPEDDPLKSK